MTNDFDMGTPEYWDKVEADAYESVRRQKQWEKENPKLARDRRDRLLRKYDESKDLHRKYYPEQYEPDEAVTAPRHFWPAWIRKVFKR